jgi:aspartyl protease family protein
MDFIKSATILGSAVMCAVASGVAVFMLDDYFNSRNAPETIATESITVAQVSSATSSTIAHGVAIPKNRDGHFYAEASINQKAVRFLVDTGASTVALTSADAQRLGFDTQHLNYDHTVITAAGKIKAASVNLASIDIGGNRVQNVQALVINEGLDQSLLGMSYLGRLTRIEATQTSLILHP